MADPTTENSPENTFEQPAGTQQRKGPPAGKQANYYSDGELNLETVYDIPVEVTVVLGSTAMPISDLLKLNTSAVIELNRKVGEPVDVFVNNRLVARGEVVIVEDHIGVTMTEIIKVEKKEKK